MIHSWIAQDLARERTRDLERAAARRRRRAGVGSAVVSGRPGRTVVLVAGPLWAFSRVSRSVADAASIAATRLEGRSA